MSRHRFIIVVPVADRPRHIQACLASLRALLRRHPYDRAIRVLIADDSADPAQVAANRAVAAQFGDGRLQVSHFGPDEQYALAAPLQATLPGVVGTATLERFGHKGQGVMRNIAWLKVAQMLKGEPDDDVLIWSLDSDQEFCVNLADGSIDYAIDFFGSLDRLFTQTDALVATGKVVGDPPVSPAVMTASFLADVDAYIAQVAAVDPQAACSHHGGGRHAGDAAYHDMADLFGFQPAAHYAYPCPLAGPHNEADGFSHFAARVNSFFYGEHPTRISCYEPAELFDTVKPARTVYAGNFMFRPAALAWFMPFAALRLRMSGPTLGRILRAELGPRFVSANLPMLHKRTVASGGQSEFRPGIETRQRAIDMSGEFERQFYGDVMLFAVEKLTATSPLRRAAMADFSLAIDTTHGEMLARYNARQQAILAQLAVLEARLARPDAWWLTGPAQAAAERFRDFCANVRFNFGADSSGHALINDSSRWQRWRGDLVAALERHGDERDAWTRALCAL